MLVANVGKLLTCVGGNAGETSGVRPPCTWTLLSPCASFWEEYRIAHMWKIMCISNDIIRWSLCVYTTEREAKRKQLPVHTYTFTHTHPERCVVLAIPIGRRRTSRGKTGTYRCHYWSIAWSRWDKCRPKSRPIRSSLVTTSVWSSADIVQTGLWWPIPWRHDDIISERRGRVQIHLQNPATGENVFWRRLR